MRHSTFLESNRSSALSRCGVKREVILKKPRTGWMESIRVIFYLSFISCFYFFSFPPHFLSLRWRDKFQQCSSLSLTYVRPWVLLPAPPFFFLAWLWVISLLGYFSLHGGLQWLDTHAYSSWETVSLEWLGLHSAHCVNQNALGRPKFWVST